MNTFSLQNLILLSLVIAASMLLVLLTSTYEMTGGYN
jgi:hypothetical protein